MAATFFSTQFENGLTVLGEVSPSSMSSAVGFFVKTGSRDETPLESGVSHFLEHMMFKGTPRRSAIDINLELGNLGAQANAFTSEENTVYYASVIPENFSAMQDLLADMLRPSLDPSEFDMEKKVILEEIALYQDRPHFYLFERAFKDFFGDHPAGNSVLGTHESISELTRDQMQEYFDRRYSPSNLVLAASGNFSWSQFVEDARRQCGAWKRYDVGRTTRDVPAKSSLTEYRKKNLTHSHAVLLAPGVSAQDPSRYALSLLANILGDGSGSRMYWELVDKGLADSASCDSDERDGTGCFSAYVSTTPDKLDMVVEVARSILATALEFSDADLARAKAKVEARIVLNGELPMGRLMALGLEWNYRESVTPLAEIVARIRKVTRNDIHSALERYPLSSLAEYRLLPED
jgi:predicted Zn-dependent peptidase